MSTEYTRDHCKLAVGKILQTIGWHSINSTPLEVLTDILVNYIRQISRLTGEYANEFGQTDPNLDHLGLAFQEMGVNLAELEEYATYVNFVPPAPLVPKYPLPKESNLNFLKPGSKEVVTRPIHINEHLPPMYPLLEEQNEPIPDGALIKKETDDDGNDHKQFKKPSDLIAPEFKRSKKDEESSRPTREISSVMMTTSGFLSPACEGKLPERKAPLPPVEPPKAPSPILPVPELVTIKKKAEKKKERPPKDSTKTGSEEKPSKKSHGSKEHKSKPSKNSGSHPIPNAPFGMPPWTSSHFPGNAKMPPLPPAHKTPSTKSSFNKTLAAAKAKTEKLNTTITPIPIKSEPPQLPLTPTYHQVDKLVTEPDKKKINILKKISNVKERHEKPPKHRMSPHMIQQTRDIVNKINLSSDITIEPINPTPIVHRNSDYFFDDCPRPGTPPTPKTPDILRCSPPPVVIKERRKRKDKTDKPDKPKVKKPRKLPAPPAHFMDPTVMDMTLEHAKPLPPEPHFMRQPLPPFAGLPNQPFHIPLANFGGPGLIPHPFNTPLFPFSTVMPSMQESPLFQHVPKSESTPKAPPKIQELVKQEPAEIVQVPVPVRSPSPVPPSTPPPLKIEDLPIEETPKKSKEHKKDKKDKIKKKNKKEKVKDKSEKKKLKEAKKEKEKEKKKKKIPKEEPPIEVPSIPKILLKVNSPSPRPETPDTLKKLNIKPIVKKEESASPERKRETSPGLAKIAALVTGPPKPKNPSPVLPVEKTSVETTSPSTPSRPPGRPRIHPLKTKTTPKIKKVQQPYTRQDAEGNTVWFCPECDMQDDGRPMIGCDGCDAWYHWVCVGIQVPPDNNENWYCRRCLAKKNADLSSKKKKRKKKNQPI